MGLYLPIFSPRGGCYYDDEGGPFWAAPPGKLAVKEAAEEVGGGVSLVDRDQTAVQLSTADNVRINAVPYMYSRSHGSRVKAVSMLLS